MTCVPGPDEAGPAKMTRSEPVTMGAGQPDQAAPKPYTLEAS